MRCFLILPTPNDRERNVEVEVFLLGWEVWQNVVMSKTCVCTNKTGWIKRGLLTAVKLTLQASRIVV